MAHFAAFSGVNLVLADGVSGRVTARLDNAPWDEALLAILSARGLTARPFGANRVVSAERSGMSLALVGVLGALAILILLNLAWSRRLRGVRAPLTRSRRTAR